YEIPNIHLDTYAVLTNNIPTGAFRGFGGPQGALAAEGQMNRLALALNIDPVELRMRNVIHEGSIASVGTPFPKGVSMPQVVERCATESVWTKDGASGWKHPTTQQPSNPSLRRGIGFACGFKNVGYSFGFPEQSWATVEIHGNGDIEEVIVR